MTTIETYPVAANRCPCCGGAMSEWTAGRIIAAIRTYADQHGRPPTADEWRKSGGLEHPTNVTALRVFGTWNSALAAAGVTVRPRHSKGIVWTEKEIIDAMLDWVVKEGRWPVIRDWLYATDKTPSYRTVIDRFGTWNAARKAAGYTGSTHAQTRTRSTDGKKVRRARRRADARRERRLAGV